jgi:hypothetical protein
LRLAAQNQPIPSPPPINLEAIEALKCVFTAGAIRRGGGAEPRLRPATKVDLVTIQLVDIDTNGGEATLKRGGRSSSVSVRSDRSNLYFLSVDRDSNVLLTTVFAQESRPGRLKAVHSEVGTDARQLYGECEVVK